jgi:hypothetical protein
MRIFKTILCLWRHQMNSFGEVDLDEERFFSLSSVVYILQKPVSKI